NHSDVGGYTAITHPIRDYHRSRELYMRWAELSAFNVVFRTHEGNKPDVNHQAYTDAETIAHTARMVAVYNGWKGYRRQLVDEAARTGAPVVRPLWMHYPDDPVTYTLNHEAFLVGYDLLVAPVTDPGRTTVRAYLPDSEWVHLWSGQTFTEPGWHTVDAPIGEPAVFFRAGSPAGREFAEMTLADL
ncbi:MAG: TIM-barrel domain-containing protein, partial [Bacteroidota bacterium]